MTPSGRIKICGVTDEAAIAACIAAQVDWVGFVFHPASPRAIDADRASALARLLPSSIRTVGLFVAPTEVRVAATLAACPIDVLQLYDTPARAAGFRARFGLETWLAHPIAHPDELASLPPADAFDLLLVEARAPGRSAVPGGHGTRLDWSALAGRLDGTPWMLAGGLDASNVADAIARSGAPRVDVSSGVESARGVKDPTLIRMFAAAARAAYADRVRGAA